MKKINKYLLVIILFITFTFTCMSDVKAVTISGNCKNDIDIIITYEGDTTEGVVKKRIYRNGKENIEDIPTLKNQTKVVVNFSRGVPKWIGDGAYNLYEKDVFTVQLLRKNSVVKTCTVTDFNKNKNVITATITPKKSMWYDVQTSYTYKTCTSMDFTPSCKKFGAPVTVVDNDGNLVNDTTFIIDEHPVVFPEAYKVTGNASDTVNDVSFEIDAMDYAGWGFWNETTNGFKYKLNCKDSKNKAINLSNSASIYYSEEIGESNGDQSEHHALISHIITLTAAQLKEKYTCDVTYTIVKQSGYKTSSPKYEFEINKGKLSGPSGSVQVSDKNGNTDVTVEENESESESGIAKTTIKGIDINGSQEIDCDAGDESLREFISEYWGYFLIGAPVLLIVMITIDFAKALFSSDQDLLRKAVNDAVKRTLAAILLLVLPVIISTILGFFGIDLCI